MRNGFILMPAVLLFSLIVAAATASPTMISQFPSNGELRACTDTPLRITFAGDVQLGSTGLIEIYDAATDQQVDSLDIAARAKDRNPATAPATTHASQPATRPAGPNANRPVAEKNIGGTKFAYYPIEIDGANVEIDFPNSLEYGKRYSVKIAAGVFKDTNAVEWQFAVRSAPETKNRIIVATDFSGDFNTVQGAIDSIPAGNTTPTTIFIKTGIYTDLVNFADKHALTIIGEDRKQTILQCVNNNNFNTAGNRGVFNVRNSNSLIVSNLTFRNLTPVNGSQAETILIRNKPDSKGIITNCDFYSTQDTVQISGQTYIKDCYIEGTVDFIWGDGPCFFENCHIRALRTPGYYTQIRNKGDARGMVFYRCVFDGSEGVTRNVFARIRPTAYPESECVIIKCKLGPAVSPRGFLFDGNEQDAKSTRFYEYASTDLEGKLADVSERAQSRQLKQPDDAQLIENYSDVTWVLGGWTPVIPVELK